MRLQGVRRGLRRGVERALHWSGGATLHRVFGEPSGAVILMYHSVPDRTLEPWIDPRNAVPAATFARQMRFLARHRRVVALAELVDDLAQGRTPAAGTVAITFDDGYRDNLCTAAGILADLGLPATLYLATGYVSRGESQWVDRLFAAFRARTRDGLELGDRRFDLGRRGERREAHRLVGGALLVAGWEGRRELLQALDDQLRPAARPPRLTLTWEEVREIRRRHPGFEIGVHTRDHLDLLAHAAEAPAELAACREDAARELGEPPRSFSYPYGRTDAATALRVRSAGFESAVRTEPVRRVRAGADRFALPRVEAPRSLDLLRFRTGGAYPDLAPGLLGRP